MEVKLRDFESMNLFSNRNLEKVMSSVVNKSSNAVLINMFEDSVILLDHTTGQFYAADYEFDPKKLSIRFENFEPVELIKEDNEFKNKVVDFFDEDNEISVNDLAETYKEDVLGQEKFIDELIHDAMMTKDFSNLLDWNKVKEVKEEVDIADEKWFKIYQKRIETNPLMEVKLFDWEKPVVVSLVETEAQTIVNETAIEKANELWRKEDFKAAFSDAASTFIEDVEEGTEKIKELFEAYPQIFALSRADRKSVLGKTILTDKNLKENMEILLKGIDLLFEKFDLGEMKQEYLSEWGYRTESAEDEEEEKEEPEEEEEGEEKAEKKESPAKEKEEAPELSAEELGKLSTEIKGLADKVEDEALKEKLEKIAEKLKGGMEEGTRPDIVKEAISILIL
jgi:hypothetical protein